MSLTGPQKAVVGAIITALVGIVGHVVSVLSGIGPDATLGDLTQQQVLTILAFILGEAGAVFGGVYYTTNKPKEGVLLASATVETAKGEIEYEAEDQPDMNVDERWRGLEP